MFIIKTNTTYYFPEFICFIFTKLTLILDKDLEMNQKNISAPIEKGGTQYLSDKSLPFEGKMMRVTSIPVDDDRKVGYYKHHTTDIQQDTGRLDQAEDSDQQNREEIIQLRKKFLEQKKVTLALLYFIERKTKQGKGRYFVQIQQR